MKISNNLGLTAQGNEYQKSNAGKKAGLFIGGIIPTIASLVNISQIKDTLDLKNSQEAIKNAAVKGSNLKLTFADIFKLPEKLLTTKNIKLGAIGACAIVGSAITGLLLGNLYDKCINKERMAEADGMAKLNEK